MKHAIKKTIWSGKGFTVVELLVIVVVMGILVAIGLPSFLQWRQNLEYRSTARDIVSILRNAQSRTIAANLQHRVEFDAAVLPAIRRYRMTRGDRPTNSTPASWAVNIIQDWITIPPGVTLNALNLNANVGPPVTNSVDFNSDSTARLFASPATITVRDNTNTVRFTITVTQVGRVSITP
jgi:Tfp pilus assembly protein FimT